jgi:hypothetical protein
MIKLLLNSNIPVHAQPDKKSPVLGKLMADDEVEVSETVKKDFSQGWREVTRKDGLHGYVTKGLTFRTYLPRAITDDECFVHDQPAAQSPPRTRVQKGGTLYVFERVMGEGGRWVRVRTMDGSNGFIPETTGLEREQPTETVECGSESNEAGNAVMKLSRIFRMFK